MAPRKDLPRTEEGTANRHQDHDANSSQRLFRGLFSFFIGLLGVAACWLAGYVVLSYESFSNAGGDAGLKLVYDMALVGALGATVTTMIQPKNDMARMWFMVLAAVSVVPYLMAMYLWSFAAMGAALVFTVLSIFPKRGVAFILALLSIILLALN